MLSGHRNRDINSLAYTDVKNPILKLTGSNGKVANQFVDEFKHKASLSNIQNNKKQIFPPLKRRY